MAEDRSVSHIIHEGETLCGLPRPGEPVPHDGPLCAACAEYAVGVLNGVRPLMERALTAEAEVAALRAEVHELEKPHACAYSGMSVAECVNDGDGICDCFGGSTWPQRAMTAESEVMRLSAALDSLLKDKADHDFIGVARIKEATGRG